MQQRDDFQDSNIYSNIRYSSCKKHKNALWTLRVLHSAGHLVQSDEDSLLCENDNEATNSEQLCSQFADPTADIFGFNNNKRSKIFSKIR